MPCRSSYSRIHLQIMTVVSDDFILNASVVDVCCMDWNYAQLIGNVERVTVGMDSNPLWSPHGIGLAYQASWCRYGQEFAAALLSVK